MKLGDDEVTFSCMPPNFQSINDRCFFYAFDRQMKKLMERAKDVAVWAYPDNVNPKYYGYMAAMLNSQYYSSDLSDSDKLEVIKSTMKSHMYAGTVTGINELLNKVFSDAKFEPWYNYGGEPYHFKVITDSAPSEELLKRFSEILKNVKSQRSIIDGIETQTHNFDINAYAVSNTDYFDRLEENE